MNSRIFRIQSLYEFRDFLAIQVTAIVLKIFENHIQSEFVKIQEFILFIIIVIFPQKWAFWLENGNFEMTQYQVYSL